MLRITTAKGGKMALEVLGHHEDMDGYMVVSIISRPQNGNCSACIEELRDPVTHDMALSYARKNGFMAQGVGMPQGPFPKFKEGKEVPQNEMGVTQPFFADDVDYYQLDIPVGMGTGVAV